MNRQEIVQALKQLGKKLEVDVEITVAGGAALLMAFDLDRGTVDVDAVEAIPGLDESFRRAVREVADELELAPTWLNDSVKGYREVLASGYRERRRHLGDFNRLQVYALGRRDLILLKLFAMRAQDIEDLRSLEPTENEIEFVRENLERLSRVRPDRALAMELYLEQGEG